MIEVPRRFGKLSSVMVSGTLGKTMCRFNRALQYPFERAFKDLNLHTVTTMIDPETGWFEMQQISYKDAYVIANEVELAWLT
jgi:hypothetical protein